MCYRLIQCILYILVIVVVYLLEIDRLHLLLIRKKRKKERNVSPSSLRSSPLGGETTRKEGKDKSVLYSYQNSGLDSIV